MEKKFVRKDLCYYQFILEYGSEYDKFLFRLMTKNFDLILHHVY